MKTVASYMQRALDLARRGEGRTCPNPPVGAVVVKDGKIVGEGFHPRAGQPHAEIFALREAGEAAQGSEIFITLEPCCHTGRTGPCCEALVAAGIRRVVVGCEDPNPLVAGKGIRFLKDAGIEVQVGSEKDACRRLIAPFAKHILQGLPYFTMKAALSLDGKTATASGESQWISNEKSRAHAHQFRDRVDAIMVGVGTVLRDNPRLTTRLPSGGKDPVRIVVDSRLRSPAGAAVFKTGSSAPTIVATTPLAARERIAQLEDLGAKVLICNEIEGQGVDLRDLARQLGSYPLQHVLLEGGALLNQSALDADLIDRVMFFFAPKIFGGSDGKGPFSGKGCLHLGGATLLKNLTVQQFDGDILLEGEVDRCSPV